MSEDAEAPPKGLPISLDRLERLRHDALRQGVYDEVRAQIAGYLGTTYSRGTLSEAERRIAVELFEILAQDVAETVRKALA